MDTNGKITAGTTAEKQIFNADELKRVNRGIFVNGIAAGQTARYQKYDKGDGFVRVETEIFINKDIVFLEETYSLNDPRIEVNTVEKKVLKFPERPEFSPIKFKGTYKWDDFKKSLIFKNPEFVSMI